MKFENVIVLLCVMIIFSFGCETGTKPATKPRIENWNCIPSQQVGLIKPTSTEGDIIFAYGKENVSRGEIGFGEGNMVNGTLLFAGSDNELVIIWKEGQEYKSIESIKVRKENTKWTTPEGITVGTPLQKVVDINGKDFKFAGFEWDFAGVVLDWDGGAINKNLKMYLEPTKNEAIFPELIGEETFTTDHPKAKEAGLKVASFEIIF